MNRVSMESLMMDPEQMHTQMQTPESVREQILAICQRLYQRNLLAAADGNVSCLVEPVGIFITPSGKAKGFISANEIATISLDGQIVSGQPSNERLMHLEIYRTCKKARAVIHAHPPYAVAWSVARPNMTELPIEHLSEVILGAGTIPIVPYARPTTQQMAEHLRPYLPQHRALILARHGAVCWGESLEEAMHGIERLEHAAQMLFLAEQLGGASSLPAEEIEFLKAMRRQIGERLL